MIYDTIYYTVDLGLTNHEPLYYEILDIINGFLTPLIVKYMEKSLDATKPRYSEHILPVPWSVLRCIEVQGFHCVNTFEI